MLLRQTERLQLHVLEEYDAQRVLAFYQANVEFRRAWSPTMDANFLTLDGQRERLRSDRIGRDREQGLALWLTEIDQPAIVGMVALRNIVRGAFWSCHLGYEIHQSYANRGYMSEALQAVIQYAFVDLRLHRIEANIMPRNQRSIRVVEKLGFEHEGLARKYLKINGIWEDHIHYVRLNAAVE
ncbi:GNAT family N-acetyltransferase [Herpetosiphon llansteffanensis]|uniref:GNAT family N-acetyltransferase n=1 Tax=Herpetosiphon llansteffanensis TaxID=2094568 RepID=UPI000D7BBF0A|nr:GNAT family N-acetyltransferase [Herpetosiphon llansteffanensis]